MNLLSLSFGDGRRELAVSQNRKYNFCFFGENEEKRPCWYQLVSTFMKRSSKCSSPTCERCEQSAEASSANKSLHVGRKLWTSIKFQCIVLYRVSQSDWNYIVSQNTVADKVFDAFICSSVMNLSNLKNVKTLLPKWNNLTEYQLPPPRSCIEFFPQLTYESIWWHSDSR